MDHKAGRRVTPRGASFFSVLFFRWLEPLMKKSFKSTLGVEDLCEATQENSSDYLCERLDREWRKELDRAERNGKPSFLRAILRCFRFQLLVLGLAVAVAETAKVLQPIFLARMLRYFISDTEDADGNAKLYCYLNALAAVGTLIVVSASFQPFEFFSYVVGMRMRAASGALIYRKTLRLSQKALTSATTGHIVNLISTDAARFDYVPGYLHYPWLSPIETAAVLAILWSDIGVASIPGLALVLLVIPAQAYLGKLFTRLRVKMASRSDERLQVMDQLLAGIKVIKLYCWEKSFAELVGNSRSREMKLMKIVNYLTVLSSEIGCFTFAKLAIGSCVVTWILTHGTWPSLDTMVVVMRLISTIQDSLVYYLPFSVEVWTEMISACARIQEFLLLEELHVNHIRNCSTDDVAYVELESYTGDWGTSDIPTLRNVTLRASKELLAIVGPVGSGKTTLLMALLGELPLVSGRAEVAGRLAYSAQLPWVFSGTLRQNILFGRDYDADRYRLVVEACALDRDMSLLPNGDLTLVGEKGVMLSGGQKARVSLARAAYHDADIYLLDDPLSAVDAAVAKHVFERCIKGLLKDRLRVIVTHQLLYAREADRIVVMAGGAVKAVGSCADLLSSSVDIDQIFKHPVDSDIVMLDVMPAMPFLPVPTTSTRSHSDVVTSLAIDASADRKRSSSLHCLRAPLKVPCFGSVEALHLSTLYLPMVDESSNGSKSSNCSVAAATACENGLRERRSVASASWNVEKPNGGDDIVEERTTLLESHVQEEASLPACKNGQCFGEQTDCGVTFDQEDGLEEVAEGNVKWTVYKRYFGSGTNAVVLSLLVLLMACGQAGFMVIDWFLTEWAYAEQHGADLLTDVNATLWQNGTVDLSRRAVDSLLSPYIATSASAATNSSIDNEPVGSIVSVTYNDSGNVYMLMCVYGVALSIMVALSLTRAAVFYRVCAGASVTLHNAMLVSVLRAPIRFFDVNPVGRILNRFSSDVMYIDDYLPVNCYDFIALFMVVVGTVVMAAANNPWVLLPLAPILAILIYVRKVYAATSRAVKRLVAVTKSPVISHVSTSIAGIHSVHAYRAQERFIKSFDVLQDGHTEAHYTLLCVKRWLAIRMDATCISFVAIVIVLCIVAKDNVNIDPGTFALTVTYTVSMTVVFQFVVAQSIEVENMMTSVERILDYTQMPSEGALPSKNSHSFVQPPADWPREGRIDAVKASLQYSEDSPFVLQDLNFSIAAGEKIGICGRTGAGKSSLLAMLFRLSEYRGQVSIDDVEISQIALHDLRRRIAIIPQDPVLFSGTVRSNMDPFAEMSDDDLWNALRHVELAGVVKLLPGGLDASVNEGGSNFSVGQRQLLCLARALLRQTKILVVDEATANVDLSTSTIIQETIRKKFAACTILTIAHRLDSVMEADRIMVLESGRILEFDEPHVLLQRTDSLLLELVRKSGKDSARLCKLAKEAYGRRQAIGRSACPV